jgi:hypothetical protein
MIVWPWARVPAGERIIIQQIFTSALIEIPIQAAKAPRWEPLWELARSRPRSLIMQAGEGTSYYLCIWSS